MLKAEFIVDAGGVLSWTERLSRQVPFAMSRAVNATLKGSQGDVRQTLPGHFTLRRKTFVERTVKITQFANKRNIAGVLAIDPTRDFLAKFEDDTVKSGQGGKSLAVPLIGGARPAETAIVPKALRLQALQLKPVQGRKGKARLEGLKGTFTITTPKGTYVIQRTGGFKRQTFTFTDRDGSQRTGKMKRQRISTTRVLYAFKKTVPIQPVLGFDKTARKGIDQRWEQEMRTAFDEAERTAR